MNGAPSLARDAGGLRQRRPAEAFPRRPSAFALAAAVAVLFAGLHLPFLPASLEDVDSINFALGLRRFDVVHHQPHPPGYPVFIALAHVAHLIVSSEARAIALLGIAAGALGVFALVRLFRELDPESDGRAIVGALIAVGSPLYWFTAIRPLSDVTGLAAAVAVQAMTLAARTGAAVGVAALCAGLASGIRSQVAWLTAPLLLLAVLRSPRADRITTLLLTVAGFGVGLISWAVPLVLLTGGVHQYWAALSGQGAEDLSGIQMLWTMPTPRVFAAGLYYAFVAPWASSPLAIVVLVLAALGIWRMWPAERKALATLAAAFAPYFIFDLLFQETFTTRYALPLVVPVSFLAMRGLGAGPIVPRLGVAIAAWSIAIATLDTRAYAQAPAPAFRMLDEMRIEAARLSSTGTVPVLAAHRREDLDLRRPLVWMGERMPRLLRLPAPPKHEWLELVKYWNGGGRAPIWFAADPLRSDLALIDRDAPDRRFTWPVTYPVLLGGIRPNEMTWHVFNRPGWFLGEGWALTPETAGVAEQDHRGPSIAPIEGWVRRRSEALTIMLGGRNMLLSGPARVRTTLDGGTIDDSVISPGFFLRMIDVPAGALDGAGGYARLTVAADTDRLAVEQFDAQSQGSVMFGYADGWYEHEYSPATGLQWRWASARADLLVRTGGQALRFVLAGRAEGFSRPSHVKIRLGSRVLAEDDVQGPFSIEVGIPAGLVSAPQALITIETDQTYVPAERSRRTGDRRRLGLRITECSVSPVS